jgi:hypothetical protein
VYNSESLTCILDAGTLSSIPGFGHPGNEARDAAFRADPRLRAHNYIHSGQLWPLGVGRVRTGDAPGYTGQCVINNMVVKSCCWAKSGAVATANRVATRCQGNCAKPVPTVAKPVPATTCYVREAPGVLECLKCPSHMKFANGAKNGPAQCVSRTPTPPPPPPPASSAVCHAKCATCQGPGATACLTCPSNLKFAGAAKVGPAQCVPLYYRTMWCARLGLITCNVQSQSFNQLQLCHWSL